MPAKPEDTEALIKSIDQYMSLFKVIPANRRYWLIRTQGGQFYPSFRDYDFVAIEHEEISLFQINKAIKQSKGDERTLFNDLRALAASKYPDELRPGLIASQIIRFFTEIKKGDVVVIPSENSERISVGMVEQTAIHIADASELRKTGCTYEKRKKVKWIQDIRREDLDVFLYRMFQSHQAVNDITQYSEIIERSIGNFFITEESTSLVLTVKKETGIRASGLFAMGNDLMQYAENFIKYSGLPFDIDDIEVKIALNSPGKIQLKGPSARTIWLLAVLFVGVNGGGLKINVDGFNLDLSTDGIVQKIIDYQNNGQDRELKERASHLMDSLQVTTPDDAVTVLKQFSTNKDLPK